MRTTPRTLGRTTGTGYATVQPSPSPSGVRGRRTGRRRGGFGRPEGDVVYLWLLFGIELVLTVALRHWSRNHHGG